MKKLLFFLLFAIMTYHSNGQKVYAITNEEYSSSKDIAKLWINEEETILSSEGVYSSQARALWVTEDEVIVLLNEEPNSYTRAIKLWKNGIVENITPDTSKAIGTSMYVYQNDIYISGSMNYRYYSIPTIWKNGVVFDTISDLYPITFFSIFVTEGHVYTAGYRINSSYISVAAYWDNGEEITLSDGVLDARAMDIFVTPENDVYVAGSGEGSSRYEVAKLWINGEEHNLSSGESNAVAYSVLVSEGDIYVAGFENHPEGSIPVLWKNGEREFLSESSGHAHSLFLFESDLYIGGKDQGMPVVWKNSTPHLYYPGGVSGRDYVRDLWILPDTTSNIPHITNNLSSISVYPNPATHCITVDLPSDVPSAEFALFDIYGRLLFTETIRSKAKINLPNVASGVYLYRVNSREGNYSGKLVIDRQ